MYTDHNPKPLPGAVTLRELRQMLDSLPPEFDDFVVIVAQDPEGNGFDALGTLAVGWYRNQHDREFRGATRDEGETWSQVMAQTTRTYVEGDQDEGDDGGALDEHDRPAVCLWP